MTRQSPKTTGAGHHTPAPVTDPVPEVPRPGAGRGEREANCPVSPPHPGTPRFPVRGVPAQPSPPPHHPGGGDTVPGGAPPTAAGNPPHDRHAPRSGRDEPGSTSPPAQANSTGTGSPHGPDNGAGGDTNGAPGTRRRGAGSPANAAGGTLQGAVPPAAPHRGQPPRSGADFRDAWRRAESAKNAGQRRGRGPRTSKGAAPGYAPGMGRREPRGGGAA